MSTLQRAGIPPALAVIVPLLVITGLLAVETEVHALALQLYVLPVVVAGYYFGRTRALGAALAAVGLVSLLELAVPGSVFGLQEVGSGRWLSVGIWGGVLLAIAGAVGHLYEAKQRAFDDLANAYHGVLEVFSKFIDNADQYTEAHSVRVSIYATAVAQRMDLPPELIEDIRVASLLHDVGKLELGADVLRKAGELDEEEWKKIRRHPALGAQMVGRAGGLLRGAVPLILYHHERVGGGGYYDLEGSEIPIGARIIAVCDAFDAMTTDRAYRPARTPGEAIETLQRDAGSHFDPDVVRVFVEAMLDERSGLAEVRSNPHAADVGSGAPLRAVAGTG